MIGAIVLWFLLMVAVSLLYAPLLMRAGLTTDRPWESSCSGSGRSRHGSDDGLRRPRREIAVRLSAVGIVSSIVPLFPWLLDNPGRSGRPESCALHDMAVATHVVRA